MHRICQRIARINLRRRVSHRITTLRHFIRRMWARMSMCSKGKLGCYPALLPYSKVSSPPAAAPMVAANGEPTSPVVVCQEQQIDADLVPLKIGLLGDNEIGKTSFLVKYMGEEKEQSTNLEMKGIKYMDKTQMVRGARISYSIWQVEGGDGRSFEDNHIPTICQDSVAILFMFDLTSRCTLNSVVSWYQEARKWNQMAIPIIVGTKFDEFIQLPIDLQWTIASQARAYAKAFNATLFFSSATYNINVNKIFKFITAKLFDLPWTVERNLTVGEPIIDF
ncbi:hypothetical protein SAY87_020252 [Trapa incisa]|uniref:Septum-promoting GTP-binding protein 1 n=1 Tax=Trapa incisa TaxID=236973 RepID=A0AAN7K372_9MYRT|nr:hypothetical protein SAY87_020252 [Trapa incisa]